MLFVNGYKLPRDICFIQSYYDASFAQTSNPLNCAPWMLLMSIFTIDYSFYKLIYKENFDDPEIAV